MKNNKFVVKLPTAIQDPNGLYKSRFMDKVLNKYPWLSVSGVDAPFFSKYGKAKKGIEYATANDLITIGTDKHHDIGWVNTKPYDRIVSEVPIIDLAGDYANAIMRLNDYAEGVNPSSHICSGCSKCFKFQPKAKEVEVFDNFVRVGTSIIPRVSSKNEYYCFGGNAILETTTEIIISF